MKTFAVVAISVVALLIALGAWLLPFHPIGNSPLKPNTSGKPGTLSELPLGGFPDPKLVVWDSASRRLKLIHPPEGYRWCFRLPGQTQGEFVVGNEILVAKEIEFVELWYLRGSDNVQGPPLVARTKAGVEGSQEQVGYPDPRLVRWDSPTRKLTLDTPDARFRWIMRMPGKKEGEFVVGNEHTMPLDVDAVEVWYFRVSDNVQGPPFRVELKK